MRSVKKIAEITNELSESLTPEIYRIKKKYRLTWKQMFSDIKFWLMLFADMKKAL